MFKCEEEYVMFLSKKKRALVKSEEGYYTNDGTPAVRKGDTAYAVDGRILPVVDDTMYMNNRYIQVLGNSIHTPKGSYVLCGSNLFGPKGESWVGITSIKQAKGIAAINFNKG